VSLALKEPNLQALVKWKENMDQDLHIMTRDGSISEIVYRMTSSSTIALERQVARHGNDTGYQYVE
jgi:hypothetical protein